VPSGTWGGVLVDDLIEIGPQLLTIGCRRSGEELEHSISGGERPSSHRGQLADGDPASGDDEGSPASRRRMISPLSLRSSRWVMRRLTNAAVALVLRPAVAILTNGRCGRFQLRPSARSAAGPSEHLVDGRPRRLLDQLRQQVLLERLTCCDSTPSHLGVIVLGHVLHLDTRQGSSRERNRRTAA